MLLQQAAKLQTGTKGTYNSFQAPGSTSIYFLYFYHIVDYWMISVRIFRKIFLIFYTIIVYLK